MTTFNWMAKACGVLLLWATGAVALPAQTFTTLYSFNGTVGAGPEAAPIQGTDGNFYGTTAFGGANIYGTVYKITPSGTLTTLYAFNLTDGGIPYAGLVLGTDGSFYGTTLEGGPKDGGTIFKITSSGTLTTLYTFCAESECADGVFPSGGLVQGADGNFYGTTENGGGSNACNDGCGTVFKITPSGSLTTLHSFDGTDGETLYAGLVQATNGALYGVTFGGGASDVCHGGCGTVFKITTGGTLTTLHNFEKRDGDGPTGLVQGTDGNLYGTTFYGGANSDASCFGTCGTVFRITPSGSLTKIYNFCSLSGCADGSGPDSGVIQGTDGNLYGTTYDGGASSDGTVFEITPSGTLTTLHSFDDTDGKQPYAGLAQGTNGTFYGTTTIDGPDLNGTIYSLSVGLGPFVETLPASGVAGSSVKILGTNLTGATSVTFNGTVAVYAVDSKSLITTTVPAGATTGTIQVVTPTSGTLSSNVPFTVRP
jgi:uncharacterized repeat protein (TIGR03803 family)